MERPDDEETNETPPDAQPNLEGEDEEIPDFDALPPDEARRLGKYSSEQAPRGRRRRLSARRRFSSPAFSG